MIKISKGEAFPITVSLFDDRLGKLIENKTVSYEIRDIYDNELDPVSVGVLSESSIAPGIYMKETAINSVGNYIVYATCSGFVTSTEIVSVYDKYEEHVIDAPHNISVIDVQRKNDVITESQQNRKVDYGKTDYIISVIKKESDVDWSNPVSSGVSYAHYRNLGDDLPYMMGADI